MTTKSQADLRARLRPAFRTCMRNLRSRAGISQEKLAYEAGIDRAYYGQLERGRNGPSLETIYRLLPHLKVDFIAFATEFHASYVMECKYVAAAKKAAAPPKQPRKKKT